MSNTGRKDNGRGVKRHEQRPGAGEGGRDGVRASDAVLDLQGDDRLREARELLVREGAKDPSVLREVAFMHDVSGALRVREESPDFTSRVLARVGGSRESENYETVGDDVSHTQGLLQGCDGGAGGDSPAHRADPARRTSSFRRALSMVGRAAPRVRVSSGLAAVVVGAAATIALVMLRPSGDRVQHVAAGAANVSVGASASTSAGAAEQPGVRAERDAGLARLAPESRASQRAHDDHLYSVRLSLGNAQQYDRLANGVARSGARSAFGDAATGVGAEPLWVFGTMRAVAPLRGSVELSWEDAARLGVEGSDGSAQGDSAGVPLLSPKPVPARQRALSSNELLREALKEFSPGAESAKPAVVPLVPLQPAIK